MRRACCLAARRATPQDTISIDVYADVAETTGLPVAHCTAAFQRGDDTRHLVLSLTRRMVLSITHGGTRSSD